MKTRSGSLMSGRSSGGGVGKKGGFGPKISGFSARVGKRNSFGKNVNSPAKK